ncbi:hypothetical protein J2T56_000192 [Natronobacillus azotifigens]|uniref:YozQ family protein n=1 Tax=Natronobacillus azotifigens TaxID=472978 RepID=A0A9J6R7J7_9BACI|nr:YozQ family protein [Natronobacillus azotifigens]MCZ0701602.1 YozQ family protein [Natronobacillus azotifigens]
MSKKEVERTVNKEVKKTDYAFETMESNEIDDGIAITHEQISDTFMEGTIDGQIDSVNKDGSLKSHNHGELK